ncbi:phospholipid-translocating P-type ATPase [Microthyrium microscopicum]|uniref:Phospholipid-transporting ATPase n=1 Tax=Microthyrium microscopicum TaxID=703497 RepID=A0A6A6TZD4_9PEZI|nr:phospholipid-translocating P-type ATPase [Microthyrium microscopicum]
MDLYPDGKVDTKEIVETESSEINDSTTSLSNEPQRVSLISRLRHNAFGLYSKVVLDWLLRRKPLPPSKCGRHIPLRWSGPLIDERRKQPYISNAIRTARYTVYDFLPKQFIFQATRLSNFYFICIGVPQAIPGISTTGNYTTILPLLFFLCLTVAKEGYDDFKRHRLDKVENIRNLATVLQDGQSVGINHHWLSFPIIHKLFCFWHIQKPRLNPCDGWTKVQWQQLKVGDIIRLERDEAVPADITLLSTDRDDCLAYIETMALDGETNLKSRQAPKSLQESCRSLEGARNCDAEFFTEDPNSNLYDFTGNFTLGDRTEPLTLNNVVFRGSVLRNTKYVTGLVVFTGEECKIRNNANHHPKAKKPRLEQYANQIVLTLVAYVIILTAGCSAGYYLWHKSTEQYSFYLNNAFVKYRDIIIGFAITFNNVIPLALYVSLEIVKIGQLLLLNNDVEMYDEASNTPMQCNTNTILENLGQVDYILTDKTGTLTENVMQFRRMSAMGAIWNHDKPADAVHSSTSTGNSNEKAGSSSTSHLVEYSQENPDLPFAQRARDFVLAMTLCHTCLPEYDGESLSYQGSSPDEVALAQAAQQLGFSVLSRTSESMTVKERLPNGTDKEHVYIILDIIEFSSNRKRMSIVVKCPDGRIWLICKGADNVILPRLKLANLAEEKAVAVRESLEISHELLRTQEQQQERASLDYRMKQFVNLRQEERPSFSKSIRPSFNDFRPAQDVGIPTDGSILPDSAIFTNTFLHIESFAEEGLRTLLLADRYLTLAKYTSWAKVYQDATTSLINRQQRIEAAAESIEQSFQLLGATAIEDKLQKKVPETIEKLRRANIRIWMLTGDKRETAINIAHSAGICKPTSEIFVLDSEKDSIPSQLQTVATDMQSSSHKVLVINGDTLSHIEQRPHLRAHFYSLIPAVDSVICCRASPSQKAGIVNAIRHQQPNALTLAIGDGANDIAMIQASHVGVGISGKEGLQAARVSDYSIAQFHHLQRLLLVHGRYNYIRTAKFILMTFWKEMLFYLPQALYQRYNGYTGTSLYESWSLTVLNTLFTSLCVIIMGMFEQDLKPETLLAVPELYRYGQKNMGLNIVSYLGWMVGAVVQGLIIWFVAWAGYGRVNVTDQGIFAIGDLCFTMGILWTNWKLFIIETHYKTRVVMISFFITVGGWWIWNIFLAKAYNPWPNPYGVRNGFTESFGRDPYWWLTLILIFGILMVLDYGYKAGKRCFVLEPVLKRLRWNRGAIGDEASQWDVALWQELEREAQRRKKD